MPIAAVVPEYKSAYFIAQMVEKIIPGGRGPSLLLWAAKAERKNIAQKSVVMAA